MDFVDHVADEIKLKGLEGTQSKWVNCLMLNYFNSLAVSVRVSNPVDLLNKISANGFVNIRDGIDSSNLSEYLKKITENGRYCV